MEKNTVLDVNQKLVKDMQNLSTSPPAVLPDDIAAPLAVSSSEPLASSSPRSSTMSQAQIAFDAEMVTLKATYRQANALMAALENANWTLVTNMLETGKLNLPLICTQTDGNGMTALHHACRLQAEPYILRFLENAPDVTNWPSYVLPAKPARFTPMSHCCKR